MSSHPSKSTPKGKSTKDNLCKEDVPVPIRKLDRIVVHYKLGYISLFRLLQLQMAENNAPKH
jgi:hypothetical protein